MVGQQATQATIWAWNSWCNWSGKLTNPVTKATDARDPRQIGLTTLTARAKRLQRSWMCKTNTCTVSTSPRVGSPKTQKQAMIGHPPRVNRNPRQDPAQGDHLAKGPHWAENGSRMAHIKGRLRSQRAWTYKTFPGTQLWRPISRDNRRESMEALPLRSRGATGLARTRCNINMPAIRALISRRRDRMLVRDDQGSGRCSPASTLIRISERRI